MRSRIGFFALAGTLAACSSSPKSSSETHFLDCATDADCATLGAAYICIQRVCSVGPDLTQTTPLVTPGACVGDGLVCDAPAEGMPFVPGPEVRCDIPEPVPATVKWTADLGTVDCPVGKCPATNPALTVAPDGNVWAAVDLSPPPPIRQGMSLGRALLRFDAEGRRTLVTAITLQGSTLIPLAYGQLPHAVKVDASGHAHLFADSKEAFDAYDMSEYDPEGHLLRVRRLVEGVSPSGTFVADGSILLGYEYAAPADGGASTTPPNLLAGVALVDPEGRLAWSRSGASGASFVTNGPKRASLMTVPTVDAGSPSQTLFRLTDDGTVSRGVLFPQTVAFRVVPTADGNVLVRSAGQSSVEGSFLDLLDAEGHGVWHLRLMDQYSIAELFGEQRGTSILFQMSIDGAHPLQALMVSADGQRCRAVTVDAPHCLQFDSNGSPVDACDVLGLTPADADDVYIATRATIIRATLGALP